jgi:hypothetical protein
MLPARGHGNVTVSVPFGHGAANEASSGLVRLGDVIPIPDWLPTMRVSQDTFFDMEEQKFVFSTHQD